MFELPQGSVRWEKIVQGTTSEFLNPQRRRVPHFSRPLREVGPLTLIVGSGRSCPLAFDLGLVGDTLHCSWAIRSRGGYSAVTRTARPGFRNLPSSIAESLKRS